MATESEKDLNAEIARQVSINLLLYYKGNFYFDKVKNFKLGMFLW